MDMFKDEGIEVLGAPLGTDRYNKSRMTQHCLRIMTDDEKHESLDDGEDLSLADIKVKIDFKDFHLF